MTWTTLRNALMTFLVALGLTAGSAGMAVAEHHGDEKDPDYEDGAHPSEADEYEKDAANPQGYGERAAE